MIRVGILGPTEREIKPFINKIKDKKISEHAMLKFYSGTYEGVEVVSAFCGVCKVNAAIAAQILIDKFEVTHIVLTGIAGALHSKLKTGDIVISSETAYHDVERDVLTEYHPWMKDIFFKADSKLLVLCENAAKSIPSSNKCYTGRIITGEAFISNSEREKLIDKFNPLCVDMESAGVAHTCYVNNVPFVIIRSISDNANEKSAEEVQHNLEIAAHNPVKLVEELIKKLKNLEGE